MEEEEVYRAHERVEDDCGKEESKKGGEGRRGEGSRRVGVHVESRRIMWMLSVVRNEPGFGR